jgi:hypothetical protein
MDTMTAAANALTRIRKLEVFESEYTTIPKSEYGIMSVDDEKLFDDLTHQEKLSFAKCENTRHVLNIFTHVWVWVEEVGKWVLIHKDDPYNHYRSYTPDIVYIDGGYLLHCESLTLLKEVD